MTWIFCAGMIRSGSTLQFQLTSSIVEHAGLGHRLKYAPESEFDMVLDRYANDPALKVFKVHLCTGKLFDLATLGGAKVIYSYRDIRDVAVSAMKKFDKTFFELLEYGWLDQAIADFKYWTSMPNVLTSKYEDFIYDIENETSRINVFLSNLVNAEDIKSIASNYGIDKQRARISVFKSNLNRKVKAGEIVFDPNEQLHHNHIDDGAIGKWNQKLNRTQVHFLNCRFEDWLVEAGYISQEELAENLKSSGLIDIAELSKYWELSIANKTKTIDGLNSILELERETSRQLRGWAERTEALLRTEREDAQKLRQWAEQSDAAIATERETSRQLRDWAERTEALLCTEREDTQKLRQWAEQSDAAIVTERETSRQLRDWAERTEALLRTEREDTQKLVAATQETVAHMREELKSRKKLLRRVISWRLSDD